MDEKELEALKTSNPKAYEHITKINADLLEAKKPPAKTDPDPKPAPKPEPKDDLSLNDKVKLERDALDKKASEGKALESALMFNMGAAAFLKENGSILPKEIEEIFKAADKETYENAIQKSNATKAAIIQSFFSQQSNVELLTENQKSALADYLKLTKNGKEEKAKDVYDNLFDSALGTLKRVKKAEELNRAKLGLGSDGGIDQAYKEKLSKMAEKKFFRGKT